LSESLFEKCKALHTAGMVFIGNGLPADKIRELNTRRANAVLTEMVQFLLDADEPLKALALLDSAPAACSPDIVAEIRGKLEAMTEHVRDYAAFRRLYAGYSTHFGGALTDVGLARMDRYRVIEKMMDSFPPGDDHLEIGCGEGFFADQLLQRFPTMDLTIADMPEAAHVIEALRERHGAARVKFHPVENHALDWPTRKFSSVSAFEVIEHVPDRAEFLAGIRERLNPNGRMFLSTPDASYWVVPKHLTDQMEQHVTASTALGLVREVKAAGFSVEQAAIGFDQHTVLCALV
jgi:2-polyprenyl-3-methyl-5-hydroxy-6-metoxy-1,4-benzoquinol methylase